MDPAAGLIIEDVGGDRRRHCEEVVGGQGKPRQVAYEPEMRRDIADTSRNGLRWGAVWVCQMGDAILDDHGRVTVGSRSVDAIGQAGLGDVIGHQRNAFDTLCAQKHCKRTGMDVMSIGDQFGEEVDLYDFAHQGKPMIIDLSGAWCYWCNESAKLIEGTPSALDGYGYEGLKDIVGDGTIYWITILDANARGGGATEGTVASWYADYPLEVVPVLADQEMESTGWISPSGYPTMMFVDENMVVTTFRKNDYTKAFDAALDYADSL